MAKTHREADCARKYPDTRGRSQRAGVPAFRMDHGAAGYTISSKYGGTTTVWDINVSSHVEGRPDAYELLRKEAVARRGASRKRESGSG